MKTHLIRLQIQIDEALGKHLASHQTTALKTTQKAAS